MCRSSMTMLTLFSLSLGLGAVLSGQEDPRPSKAPLFDGLGQHARPIQSPHPDAQKYFDQGLAFLFAFNHDEAMRSFREAIRIDPDCAMAYWGIAYASGPHINRTAVPPERETQAQEALKQALAKMAHVSETNQGLILALQSRHADPAPTDRTPLNQEYAKAMSELWKRFPKDADVGALFAESLMNLQPWDLWTLDGQPKGQTTTITATLESVMKLNPDHPLALHLYIHAQEASPEPGKADEAADRLRHLQPGLGHMVHMPSHIDIRRGRWQAAIEANERAIRADARYRQTSPRQEFYRVYMLHNHHMLAFAAMMQGESKRSLAAIRAMLGSIPKEWLEVAENAAMVDGYMAAPVEVMVRFGQWDAILRQPELPEVFPIARAMRHHARAVAFAAKKQATAAREEQEKFRELAKLVAKDAPFGNNTGPIILAVADDMLEGEILMSEGKKAEGFQALRRAIDKEDQLRYDEPPDWIVPVRHALGAFLLADGQAAEAELVYREDLRRWPDNGWSLFGLAECLERQDKLDEAAKVRACFKDIWKHADVEITSSCFCVTK